MSELSEIREHMKRQTEAIEKLGELTAAGHQAREATRKEWDARLRSIELISADVSGQLQGLATKVNGMPDRVRELEVKTRDIPEACEKQQAVLRDMERGWWKLVGGLLILSALLSLFGPKLLEKVWK